MVERRWALRTVAGDLVIRNGGRPHCVHGADGDHIRIVAWRDDGAVSLGALRIFTAIVAGRCDDHDARLPGRFHRLAERIERVAFVYRVAK